MTPSLDHQKAVILDELVCLIDKIGGPSGSQIVIRGLAITAYYDAKRLEPDDE